MARIQWVGFDGDDTLWKSADYYRQAEATWPIRARMATCWRWSVAT